MLAAPLIVLLWSRLALETHAVKSLRIVSPLQALTIWDHEVKPSTPRLRFLARFRAGLVAEAQARRQGSNQNQQLRTLTWNNDDQSKEQWAATAARVDRQQLRAQEDQVEEAFDRAVALVSNQSQSLTSKSSSPFQFVGVIGQEAAKNDNVITWYARRKPAAALWTVRLIHVNRDAILKDLYQGKKIDFYAKYQSKGSTEASKQPVVATAQYLVRERSWK
jgi:hypothetical protein